MSNAPKQKLVGENLFTWPVEEGHGQIIGTHCKSCGEYYFPKTFTCPNPKCKAKQIEQVLLSSKGTVWSYSVLYYPPPPPFVPPDPFEPIPLVQVEIPEGLKILGIMEGVKPAEVKIGMAAELVIGPLYTDRSGCEIIGWKFRKA